MYTIIIAIGIFLIGNYLALARTRSRRHFKMARRIITVFAVIMVLVGAIVPFAGYDETVKNYELGKFETGEYLCIYEDLYYYVERGEEYVSHVSCEEGRSVKWEDSDEFRLKITVKTPKKSKWSLNLFGAQSTYTFFVPEEYVVHI